MSEFGDKLTAAAGRVEFIPDPNGVATRISGAGFRAMYQIAIGYDGRLLAVVPVAGLGATFAPYPQPSILAWIQSDEQGMWGRTCPQCGAYFRSDHILGTTYCPYCFKPSDSVAFITEAQKRYVETFCNCWLTAVNEKKNIALDLKSVSDLVPEWPYSEEKQQFHFECNGCKTRVDILGDYGTCPQCSRSNAREIITEKLKELERQWEKANAELSDHKSRSEQWNKLTIASVSELEAMGNHFRKILVLSPATPKRREEIENLSFQRLFNVADSLKQWSGIDILKEISNDEQTFLRKMIQRRHILIHNGGKVDQEYIEQSGDGTVRLHERIRIRSNEAKRMIQLTTKIADNLLEGFESMS